MNLFYNRTRELERLATIESAPGAQMVVLYGRRRIGKTALVNEWLRRGAPERAAYFVAYRSAREMLLQKFCASLAQWPQIADGAHFPDWETALRAAFAAARDQRLVLAIDEFPYLVEAVPEISSVLQAVWDQESAGSQLMLVISGSHYHMMHDQFQSGRGPLYGRSTADMLLKEISPHQLTLFLPRYSPAQIVETYSIIGGVPKYLELWDDCKPVRHNVENLLLSPITIFRQEGVYLIQDEIAEPRTYLAVLEAIGRGHCSPADIAKRTGIASSHVGKYLSVLQELAFIRRIVSGEVQPTTANRRGRYEISDPYLRFYYAFIHPNLALLEQERFGRLLAIIDAEFDAYVGATGFEELARRRLIELADSDGLPFVPDVVGRAWAKDVELDIAAVNHHDQVALLGECRWTSRPLGLAVLDSLQERTKRHRVLGKFHHHFALFSKSGFTRALQDRAAEEGVLLFNGPEMQLTH